MQSKCFAEGYAVPPGRDGVLIQESLTLVVKENSHLLDQKRKTLGRARRAA